MKTFAIFYEANLPKGVDQLPDGTYKQTRDNVTKYALDPQLLKLHRIGGPAFVSPASEIWCINGKAHRIGGPAIIGPYYEEWWVNGKLHRIGGPAVVIHGIVNKVKWYVEGVKLTEEDYNDLMKRLSTLTDDSDREATIAAATMFD